MTSMYGHRGISFLYFTFKQEDMMKTRMKHVGQTYASQLLLGLWGIPIGLLVGLIDTGFGMVLLKLTAFRDLHPQYLIPFLPAAGIVIAYCYLRFGGKSSKGMNLVFEVGHGEEERIPLRLIPFVISGTWLTHLFGGSAGREGVAVQIGATFSHFIGRRLPVKAGSSVFLVTGMAAGFAGLFQTPLAAVLFAMEVLAAGELRYEALFPALTASFSASMTSGFLGLEKFTFDLSDSVSPDLQTLARLLLLGLLFGFVGGMFAWCLKRAKKLAVSKIKNPLLRIALMGIFLSILLLLFYRGRYAGLGTNLIQDSFSEGTIYEWDWLLKFILTVLTLAAGFQGGEVTPLFSIGASLGAVLSGLFGFPLPFAAAMGYAAVFGSATNTFLAPVFIGAEVFGYAYMPYFFLVCAAAYTFNMNKSIYGLQKIRRFTGR